MTLIRKAELPAQGQAGEIRTQEAQLRDLYFQFVNYLDAKEKTVQTYTRALRPMFQYFQENGISCPQREDIISYRDSLKAAGRKPTTITNYLEAAKLFFQWTAQEGRYPDIAQHVKGPTLSREHKKDYLSPRQVKAVLGDIDRTTPQGLRDYAIVSLMTTCGLRTIEVSRANIEDLRTMAEDTVLFIQGKGRDERSEYVRVPAKVETALRAYLKTRPGTAPADPLFTSTSNNSKGGRMSTRSISGICKAAMVEAGYNSDRLTAHSLRHTAVTLSLMSGQSLEEVRQFARHANLNTTLIYSHALDQAKNQCSNAVADAIF